MQRRRLGLTDLHVSPICFGCWQLSPRFWGEVAVEPWAEAVRAARDAGINFIDTADAYGDGLAESELGRLWQREGGRDEWVLATKFYWNFADGPARFPDTRREHILRACEASLRRLQTDRIDLYQIHAWDALTRPDEVAAAFAALRQAGKVRWVGVSNLNVEQMELYRAHCDIASLQPPYSLLDRAIEAHVLPYCLRHNIGVLGYSSLQRGLLGGRYTPATRFDDHRATTPLFHGPGFALVLAAVEEAKGIAAELGLTMPELAVRWVLTHPALTSAIVGVKTRDHITGVRQAAAAPLPPEIWHRLATRFAQARAAALAPA
jgi:aryl-alcohol dehydrogenase-like predicted oxidoreductase